MVQRYHVPINKKVLTVGSLANFQTIFVRGELRSLAGQKWRFVLFATFKCWRPIEDVDERFFVVW